MSVSPSTMNVTFNIYSIPIIYTFNAVSDKHTVSTFVDRLRNSYFNSSPSSVYDDESIRYFLSNFYVRSIPSSVREQYPRNFRGTFLPKKIGIFLPQRRGGGYCRSLSIAEIELVPLLHAYTPRTRAVFLPLKTVQKKLRKTYAIPAQKKNIIDVRRMRLSGVYVVLISYKTILYNRAAFFFFFFWRVRPHITSNDS